MTLKNVRIGSTGPTPIYPRWYQDRIDRAADRIYEVLCEAREEYAGKPVTVDRDAVLLIVDALSSRRFMDHIESDPHLPYAVKMEFATKVVSTAAKGKGAILAFLNHDQAPVFFALLLKFSNMAEEMREFIGLRTVDDIEEIAPRELTDGDQPPTD